MTAALACDDLHKSYGAHKALAGVSCTVSAGETVALLGPNGSGKTTLLRCFAGLLHADSGSITVDGMDIRVHGRRARARMSFVPQEPSFPGSLRVGEVMKLHAALRNAAQERIGTALADAGLEAGCSDWRVGSLSTGMRHRLSLAVACVADAPLVLLDEPTASLDPAAVLQFRQLALRWKSDARTVVFSTHVLADAEALADRVVVMVGGRAMAQHAMSTLRSRVRERSVLRVEMSERNGQADAALAAGASEACWDGQTLVVTAPAELRLGILEGLARAGGVCHFETEPLALERMYMDYMTEFQETTTHGK